MGLINHTLSHQSQTVCVWEQKAQATKNQQEVNTEQQKKGFAELKSSS